MKKLEKEFLPKDLVYDQSIRYLMPDPASIPDRFKNWNDPYCDIVSSLFFSGGSVRNWKTKEGIDRVKAISHFTEVLSSFEPKHEEKIAVCAYMLYCWFDPESVGIQK